jgi:beta-lactamase regulating signal transducer with metallopeptidase domain
MTEFDASRLLFFAGEALAASALAMLLAWLSPLRKTASLRHLVWTAAFVALIALPVLAALVPGNIVFTLSAPPAAVPMELSVAAIAPPPAPEGLHFDMTDAAFALIAMWLAGAALIALRGAIASLILRSMRRDSAEHPFDESELPELASGRGYDLCVSNAEHGPVTWGFIRPVILLPHKSLFWPGERLHAALLHELAHVHRHDSLTQTVAFIACALYWPNPLVWLGARAMRREAEMAADDAVIVSGMAASTYAGELLHIAEEFRDRGLSPAMPMAARSSLAARVQSVLTPQHRSGVTSMDVLKMAGIALLATSALIAVRPALAQDAPQPPAAASVMAAPPAPPAPPSDVDAPVPPAPPSDAVRADTPVHAMHMHMVRKFTDHHGHVHVVTIDRDGDRDGDRDAAAVMADIKPQIDRAMAEVKAHQAEIRRIQEMRPQIDAAVTKALSDVRAQLAQISDEKVRARVDEALARAQAKLEASQARRIEDGQHRVILENDSDDDEADSK